MGGDRNQPKYGGFSRKELNAATRSKKVKVSISRLPSAAARANQPEGSEPVPAPPEPLYKRARQTVLVNQAQQNALKDLERRKNEIELRKYHSSVRNSLQKTAVGDQPHHSEGHYYDDDNQPAFVDEPIMDAVGDDDIEDGRVSFSIQDALESIHGPTVVRKRRYDRRTRQQRLVNTYNSWAANREAMVDAYLEWKATAEPFDIPPVSATEPDTRSVDVFAWHWTRLQHGIVQRNEENFNRSLLRCGLIGSSPVRPQWAISIRTLETYRHLRLLKPSLSMQSFAHALCESTGTLYTSTFRMKVNNAFDAYLGILRAVDNRAKVALKRDSPHWRLKHSCPCCNHRIPNEPPLEYDQILCVDGGNSCKRFKDAGKADGVLTFKSDYFLTHDEVDEYKDEVVKRKKTAKKRQPTNPDLAEEDNQEGDDADDVALELGEAAEEVGEDGVTYHVKNIQAEPGMDMDELTECVARWKANADDALKGMFNCYDESGLFPAVCRHQFLLIICDMVRSGELAKYPLAVIDHICRIVPGVKLIGYDIGCVFHGTLLRSKVGKNFTGICTMDALHGFAHKRSCACKNHPMYLPGSGLSDMDDCERFFSHSNQCAILTRHATKFHRLQYLDMHFAYNDAQKYQNLGKWLFDNYRQAFELIDENKHDLEMMRTVNGYTGDDYKRWLAEEQEYLDTIGKLPEEEKNLFAYLEALDKWREAEALEVTVLAALQKERSNLQRNAAVPVTGSEVGRGKRKKLPTIGAVQQKAIMLGEKADQYMILAGLSDHWAPTHPDYIAARHKFSHRKYQAAIDNLEKLVVSRLFELEKCHKQGTNSKMRAHLMKHLKTRSEAIRNAIKTYNTIAKTLVPPRPPIKAEEVMDYTFVGQFDILRDSRDDLRQKPWSNPINRIMRDAWFRTQRAREEIKRLDVEIPRLEDWMLINEKQHLEAIEEQQATAPYLALELEHRLARLKTTHSRIRQDLRKLWTLEGYRPSFRPANSVAMGKTAGLSVSSEEGEELLNSDDDEDEEARKLDELDHGMHRVARLG